MKKLVIHSKVESFTTNQCSKTMTVGELISCLQQFETDCKVYISQGNGYTYGAVKQRDFVELEED